jgi:hypothetical protein
MNYPTQQHHDLLHSRTDLIQCIINEQNESAPNSLRIHRTNNQSAPNFAHLIALHSACQSATAKSIQVHSDEAAMKTHKDTDNFRR